MVLINKKNLPPNTPSYLELWFLHVYSSYDELEHFRGSNSAIFIFVSLVKEGCLTKERIYSYKSTLSFKSDSYFRRATSTETNLK